MIAKRNSRTAGTVTAAKKCENDTTHNSHLNYNTLIKKMQAVIAAGAFGLMFGMLMYALCYICSGVNL